MSLVGLAACSGSSSSEPRQRNAALKEVSNKIADSIIDVDGGFNYSIALTDNGHIYAWGSNNEGQTSVPDLRNGASAFTSISANIYTAFALDNKGQMYVWGSRNLVDADIPSLRNGATSFTAISTMYRHGLALDNLGQVYAWGQEFSGEVSLPTLRNGATSFTSIQAGWYSNLALDNKGQVYVWGNNSWGQNNIPTLAVGATSFVKFAVGGLQSLAIDNKGKLYAWGNNHYNQLSIPTLRNDAQTFTTASSGYLHSLALDDQGQLYSWGLNIYGANNVPELKNGATSFTKVFEGVFQSFAIDNLGQLYSWGLNDSGQSTVPPSFDSSTSRTMPIAMGGLNAYGIDDTGQLMSFTSKAQFDSGWVSVAAGPRHVLAVTESGTVEAFGDYDAGQSSVPFGLNDVVQVVAGYAYSAALRSDGRVVEWGSHTAPSGQLIEKPDDLPRLKHLFGALTHILGITTTGTVVAWGSNQYGKSEVPDGLDHVIDVAGNQWCSAALRDNGDVVYWGACSEQMTSTTSIPGATRIAMTEYSVAAIVNGELKTWGEDWDETLTAPTGNDFVSLVSGTAAFLAVTSDGTVKSWGANHEQKITIPTEFGGLPPDENGDVCTECGGAGPVEFTDDDVKAQAAFLAQILSSKQLAMLIDALGGTPGKNLNPIEVQKLADSATASELAAARKVVTPVLEPAPPVASVAQTLPATQSPAVKVGDVVSTGQAATKLQLNKVAKVSFVVPKKALSVCSITAKAVTAKKSGSCSVKVRYTDAKKKVRTTTLLLLIE